MTLPPKPTDDSRPVVLQEPPRDLAPQWDQQFALRPEEDTPVALHPGWAAVLAPGETALWQGSATPGPRFGRLGGVGQLPLFLFGIIGLFVVLNMGLSGGMVPLVMVALFLILRKANKAAKTGVSLDRRYLLTNRTAYLARAQGAVLQDIRAFPITPTLRLGLAPRSVSFTTRRNAKGEEEAEGFLDIQDAATVHALIRDLQKGPS